MITYTFYVFPKETNRYYTIVHPSNISDAFVAASELSPIFPLLFKIPNLPTRDKSYFLSFCSLTRCKAYKHLGLRNEDLMPAISKVPICVAQTETLWAFDPKLRLQFVFPFPFQQSLNSSLTSSDEVQILHSFLFLSLKGQYYYSYSEKWTDPAIVPV